jgi:hypothetical protein
MENHLRTALLDWLRTAPAALDALTAIEEEIPARAAAPWLAIAASASADWSTKTQAGREVRIALELHSRGDDPATDAALADAVAARIEALPADQAGFAVATILFLRSRTDRRAANQRATLFEYRFRCLAS